MRRKHPSGNTEASPVCRRDGARGFVMRHQPSPVASPRAARPGKMVRFRAHRQGIWHCDCKRMARLAMSRLDWRHGLERFNLDSQSPTMSGADEPHVLGNASHHSAAALAGVSRDGRRMLGSLCIIPNNHTVRSPSFHPNSPGPGPGGCRIVNVWNRARHRIC